MSEKEFEDIKKEIVTDTKAIVSLNKRFRALSMKRQLYEDEYRKYLAKRNRLKKFLWRIYCKITSRSIKLTRKELIKHTTKKMAHIFYGGK